tara:strand:+ start:138 stop:341 length:204 start_codon:yes stop_codon:yes gene_type:complete
MSVWFYGPYTAIAFLVLIAASIWAHKVSGKAFEKRRAIVYYISGGIAIFYFLIYAIFELIPMIAARG